MTKMTSILPGESSKSFSFNVLKNELITQHKYSNMKVLTLIIILLAAGSCATKNEEKKIDGQVYILAFQDEFEGESLDTDKWVYRTDSKHWSTQLPENVEVRDGNLLLHLKKEQSNGMKYTGAGIISKERYSFGYYEASMKVPAGAGWHNSFWLMDHDGSGSTATASSTIEIDIIENDSKNPFDYGICFHRWKDEHVSKNCIRIQSPDMSKEFQIFSCVYTPEYVKFFMNEKEVHLIDISEMPKAPLNVWLTSIASWIGKTEAVDEEQLPANVEFEYVRYYEPKK